MNFMMAFDVILLMLGAYLLFAGFVMKRDGTIPPSIVPAQSMTGCKDQKGYANYLFPWVIAFAIGCLVFGLLSLGLDLNVISLGKVTGFINIVVIIAFLLLWGMFSFAIRKGHSKFF